MDFVLQPVYMMGYIYLFLYVKLSKHPYKKDYLIMVDAFCVDFFFKYVLVILWISLVSVIMPLLSCIIFG